MAASGRTPGQTVASVDDEPDLTLNNCLEPIGGMLVSGQKLTSRERPLLADSVENVGGLTVPDGARSLARASLFALRRAFGRAAGSALPAFGGFGL